MQNFKSKDKAIITDSMFNAFRAVMNNPEQRALVENGRTGSIEISENSSITVYKCEDSYLAEVFTTEGGLTRNVAHADFDEYDL